MTDLEPWLMLTAVPGVGLHRIQALLRRFGTPKYVLNAGLGELLSVPGMGPRLAQSIATHRDEAFVVRQLKLIERHAVVVLTCQDEGYPQALREIYDPPAMLFTRGGFLPEDIRALGIVGTRRISSYGRTVTERIGGALSAEGTSIISGLARGVDTAAHKRALSSGGRTIAVLGSGLDVPYPPENRELMEDVCDSGVVVSEYPMGTQPDAVNFPQRNRIISGISKGVLVVEAGESSGALITARYALEQNREVFAVPGSIISSASLGTNKLIQDGVAKLVQCYDDIAVEIPDFADSPSAPDTGREPVPVLNQLTGESARLYGLLAGSPVHVDRLSTSMGLSSSSILGILLGLELQGLVTQLPGMLFSRPTGQEGRQPYDS